MNNPSDWLNLRASLDRLPKSNLEAWLEFQGIKLPVYLAVNLTNLTQDYQYWGATMNNDDQSWTFKSHHGTWLSSDGTNVYTRNLTNPSASEKFVLEKL